ncbi:hypothetical protein T12_7752 [Trichinella patagoniensis]|uniref:Uncharacterized protein n=1 Tax=Trichinella patagoniensis TaxID=990121 RepID=A0A0V1A9H6_9BILA|nr:hypothetical protein T12_7752 [Trichinella patagoniensis]
MNVRVPSVRTFQYPMVMALQFIIALNSPALASQPVAKLATWIVDLVGIEFFPVTRDEVDFTNFTKRHQLRQNGETVF